jgi:ribosomal-protein-alanine N-acetyltransferase
MQNHRINGGIFANKCTINQSDYQILAIEQNKIIGYIGMSIFARRHYIREIVIAKEYQRKGLGMELLNALLEHVKENADFLISNCYKFNQASIKLHEKFGFEKCNESDTQIYYNYDIKKHLAKKFDINELER